MRITCPRCEAAYEVPETMLSSGLSARRSVRCARCGARWALPPPPTGAGVAMPGEVEASDPTMSNPGAPNSGAPNPGAPEALPEAEALPVAPAEAAVAEVRPLPPAAGPSPERSAGRRGHPRLVVGWIASVGVVAGLIAVFLLRHEDVAAAWPPALRLYRLLGLA